MILLQLQCCSPTLTNLLSPRYGANTPHDWQTQLSAWLKTPDLTYIFSWSTNMPNYASIHMSLMAAAIKQLAATSKQHVTKPLHFILMG
jgi:hypothetical protein